MTTDPRLREGGDASGGRPRAGGGSSFQPSRGRIAPLLAGALLLALFELARVWFVQASQEFWHSWRTFHPGTTRY